MNVEYELSAKQFVCVLSVTTYVMSAASAANSPCPFVPLCVKVLDTTVLPSGQVSGNPGAGGSVSLQPPATRHHWAMVRPNDWLFSILFLRRSTRSTPMSAMPMPGGSAADNDPGGALFGSLLSWMWLPMILQSPLRSGGWSGGVPAPVR